MSKQTEVRVERFLGREVLGGNNQPMGLLEEVRAEKRGSHYVVTAYLIGPAGLYERLDLHTRLLFGPKQRGYIARWDQLDISDEEHPRLLCSVDELVRLE